MSSGARFPQSVPRAIKGQRGDFATAGWEHVLSLGLVDEAPRVGEEAVQLLSAAPCPSERTTLIVSGTAMALLVHETTGHPAELDRALGSEASAAGGSYMQPELRGKLAVGPEIVSITADATIGGGLGSFAYDDEGVPAQRTPIVREGVFVGYMTSRESAGALGEESSGASRADGWQRVPLVRMSNVSLEPGATPYEEIVASTADGVLFDMTRSVSIDETRRVFRFACELGWEIKDGRRDADAEELRLRRRDARLLGRVRRRRGRRELARLRHPVVQQGRAAPGRAHRARHRPRPLPRREGRRVTVERVLEALGAPAHVELVEERVELLRFGESRLTYQHSEERVTLRARLVRDGRAVWGTLGSVDAGAVARMRERLEEVARSLPPGRGRAAGGAVARARGDDGVRVDRGGGAGRPASRCSAGLPSRCRPARGSAARSRT